VFGDSSLSSLIDENFIMARIHDAVPSNRMLADVVAGYFLEGSFNYNIYLIIHILRGLKPYVLL